PRVRDERGRAGRRSPGRPRRHARRAPRMRGRPASPGRRLLLRSFVIAICLTASGVAADEATRAPVVRRGESSACPGATEHSLPLPSTVPAASFVGYEQQLLGFLQKGTYRQLQWCVDKSVRDTGPFIAGV